MNVLFDFFAWLVTTTFWIVIEISLFLFGVITTLF